MKSEHPKYRFPGLNSFSEDDKEIFKGRDKESATLYAKISLYKTVVLHADSGTGKSSLIHAGLLPRLKESEENYFPVIVQFDEIVQDDSINVLTDFTLKKIELNVKDKQIAPPTIGLLNAQPNSLWKFSKVLEKAGKTLLLIFDQFENLQTFKPEQINHFIIELYDLINPKIPANVLDSIEKQFSGIEDEKSDEYAKVNQSYLFLSRPSVASLLFVIREDKLGVMSLLSEFFPDILKNDFVIRQLLIDDAYEALTIPAKAEGDFESPIFEFQSKDVAYSIINKISDQGTGRVDPVLLQIVASSLEKNQVMKLKKLIITNEDIPEVSDIVIKHYNSSLDAIREDLKLTELQISEYKKNILTKFVINERRTLVNSGSIELGASDFIDKLIEIGLVRKIPAENNTLYLQLVHDRIILPIINDPQIIKSNYFEKYLKSIKFTNKVGIISIVILLLSCICIEISYFYNSSKLQEFKSAINSFKSQLSSSTNESEKLSDSISVIADSFYGMKHRSVKDSTKFDSVVNHYTRLQKQQNYKSDSISRLYYKKLGEKDFLTTSSISLSTTTIIIVNILFWGLLLFFQFERRISLKYLFKETHIYKTKPISNYGNIELPLPLWLSPVSKTKYILLNSVKPVIFFNNTYRPGYSNFASALSLFIIVVIQFHLTYMSYILGNRNLDLNFYLNLIFLLFSIIVATIWFTPLNTPEYNNEKESYKIFSRKDFITISIYSVLLISLFKKISISSEHKKPKYTGIKNPRYRVKRLSPQFNLPDCKSRIVINKKSKIIHFVDDKGFSLALKSIHTDRNFRQFKQNIEKFKDLGRLVINSKPRLSIEHLSWTAENIALGFLRGGDTEMAVKILLYGIRQNYKSSLRLNDLLALICIRNNTKVSKDALDQLISYSTASKDKKLIARVQKWKSQNWRNKILNKPKVVFNKTEI
ncbi:MAG: Sulphatase-modifying factor protein [Segetibacter sp.]|nr:Sulphatase-modifying factor protein [Segetibacter sp.]